MFNSFADAGHPTRILDVHPRTSLEKYKFVKWIMCRIVHISRHHVAVWFDRLLLNSRLVMPCTLCIIQEKMCNHDSSFKMRADSSIKKSPKNKRKHTVEAHGLQNGRTSYSVTFRTFAKKVSSQKKSASWRDRKAEATSTNTPTNAGRTSISI